jgi:hypothetical protein
MCAGAVWLASVHANPPIWAEMQHALHLRGWSGKLQLSRIYNLSNLLRGARLGTCNGLQDFY